MRLRLSFAAIFAALFALMIACSGGQPSPSAPSAVSEPATAGGPQGSFQSSASWSCFTGAATGRVESGTNEWSVASEHCPGAAGGGRYAPASGAEPIFAPGPSNFRATVTGSSVLLQWDQGAGPSGWQLEAGSGPGLSNLAVQRIGPLLNFGGGTVPFTVNGVPNGVYFARVRATRPDFSDVSVPSNEIVVTVGGPGCAGPPDAPLGLTSVVNGSNVTLLWSAPASGSPSSYLLEVGSSPGLSDILVFDTGTSATSLQAVAPPRVYFVRLRSRNACGTSAAAASTTVAVGVPPPTTTSTTTTTTGPVTTTTSTTTSTTLSSTTSTSTSSTTTTSTPAAPTASFTYSPNPCTLSTSNAVLNCTFNASGSSAGSGTITAYLWSYLNVNDETTSATYTPQFGCGLGGGQQVNVPVTLRVRNSANVLSAPFVIPGGVTLVKITGACGFGQ